MKRNVSGLLLLIGTNFAVLASQALVAFWKYIPSVDRPCIPEKRYWVESLILLLPLVPILLLRIRWGRKALTAIVAVMLAVTFVYLVKAHVPDSNRNVNVQACNWAVEVIRRDYTGPKVRQADVFGETNYRRPNLPIVDAHTARVAYLLDGQAAHIGFAGPDGIPDYLVGEPRRIRRGWTTLARYELLAERMFGKREFVIYKRVK